MVKFLFADKGRRQKGTMKYEELAKLLYGQSSEL